LGSFEVSCFEGHYLTGDISQADFDAMREQRRFQPIAEGDDASL